MSTPEGFSPALARVAEISCMTDVIVDEIK
jgi:hypothetical protein